MKKTIGALCLTAGLVLMGTPAAMATGNGGGHTPVVVCHNVVHNPHIIIVDDDSTKLQGHLKHRTQEQLLDLVEGYDGTADEIRAKCVTDVEVTEPPVTITKTVPGETVTTTTTAPPTTVTQTVTPTETTTTIGEPTTVTETVTPTETKTITGEPTTVTETVTPTETVTNTAPAVTVTEDVPGATKTVDNVLPDTVVTKNVKGDVVTKFVNTKTNRVVAVERTPATLAYTGLNLLYLAGGVIMMLLGVILLMGRKLAIHRA